MGAPSFFRSSICAAAVTAALRNRRDDAGAAAWAALAGGRGPRAVDVASLVVHLSWVRSDDAADYPDANLIQA
jgi:hypothetical protein